MVAYSALAGGIGSAAGISHAKRALSQLTDVTITAAASGDFLRHNGTAWVDTTSAGAGLVDGTMGATDNAVVRTDGTGGTTVQGSAMIVDDAGDVTGVGSLTGSGTAQFANVRATNDFECRAWIGHGTAEQAVVLGASATTFAASDSYVTVDANADGLGAIASITCSNCQEGDLLRVLKVDGDALTFTDTASPGADQLALAGGFTATTINSTLTLFRTSGGYWAELGRAVN